MKVSFTNINFDKDILIPQNIKDLDNKIKYVCDNLPALNIVKDKNLLQNIIDQTIQFKKNKKNFVIFGTGGSNLGARALINTLIKQPTNILFFDNIDPLFFESQILNLDFKTTGFVIISKSGETPETLSQLGSVIKIAKEQKGNPDNE